jgi:hypothetical protein
MAGAPTKQGGVGYGDGAPRGDDEATAFAAMLVRVTMSARRTGDEEAAAVVSMTTPMMALPRDDESNDDAHQGARRRPPRATKAARRTGVDEAAFALTRMMPRTMTSPPAMRTPTTAPTTMPTTTPRGAQSQGRPGRLTSTAQGAYARRPPPTTATNSDDSADKVEKPRATDKADEATRDCARRVRVAVARKSAMAT